jgi:1,4-alpha-glucan branching enzyme
MKSKIKPIKKTSKINKMFLIFIVFICFAFSIIGQDTVEWIGSYSSNNLESEIKLESKTYFYWQIESLKRAVSPRYIKLIDIENYTQSGKFINKGILFSYFGLRNSDVSVCGNFSSWRCLPMKRNKYGVFYLVVKTDFRNRKEELIKNFEYKFQVDNIFEPDPTHSNQVSDGVGSYYSEFTLEENEFDKQTFSGVIEDELLEDLDFMIVEFRIYKPKASVISLVGDFNQWNPEHDYLLKDGNGVFTIRKKLRPGEYLYNLIVDGEKILDLYNPNTRHRVESDELSSYIKVVDSKSKNF